MQDYRLENLSEDDFEALVNTLCQRILGTGIVSFAKGKDGGRDGRFTGTANNYPSEKENWGGQFIIQSKHTTDYDASCSDKPFFGNQTSIINGEIEKIKELKANGEIDCYLLFTNRKETGSREDGVKYIKQQTKLEKVDIIGKDTLHSWLSQNDDVARQFKIGIYALPLILTEFEIKDIIIAFSKNISIIKTIQTLTEKELIIGITKERKNTINNLSQDYYENEIRRKSQLFFDEIDDFLSNPINEEYVVMYYNFAFELSNKIIIKRDSFHKFEEIFMYLYDIIFEANKIELEKDKRLIWIFLHHLYFNCHIGIKE
jgi:hypothetical protein